MIAIPFFVSPNLSPPFSANFILDGASYLGAVTWNFAAQRWYFTLSNNSGNLVWNGPLLGSTLNNNLALAPGIFTTSTLVYRADLSQFQILP